MRSSRTIAFVVALALAALLPFAGGSATATAQPAAPAAPAAEQRAAQATVTGQVSFRKVKGKRTPFLVGRVTPKKGPVFIQKATKCNRQRQTCNFTFFRKVFLKNGKYTARIDAPRTQRGWVWRAKVGNSFSPASVTCTIRPGQQCKVPY